MKHFSRFVWGFLIGVMGVALCTGSLHSNLWAKEPPPSLTVDSTPIDRSTTGITSFAPVVKKAAPSIVNIYSTHVVHYRQQYNPFSNDPWFRQFFGGQNPEDHQLTRREQVLGSGSIITPDGYILTANHVIEDADEIKIAITGNKQEYKARVVGGDPDTDVAVLKIDAKDLPAITLGDSDKLEVGDIALAIGNPFNISQPGGTPTVTMGIVSALGRSGLGFNSFENFIQTDAAINPGNSGGALVDVQGRLIGVNTAIAGTSGGNEGIGFAVPINLARHVIDRLIHGGKVTRGYLGVLNPQDVTPDLASQFNLPNSNGALVGDVAPGTPAEKAAIKSGDVIVEFNDTKITDANDLLLAVSGCSPDTEATVKFLRNGEEHTIKLTLAQRPSDTTEAEAQSNQTDALDGVTVGDLDSDARQQLQIPDDVRGALVTDVQQDSHAADAGLEKGDVIVQIDRHSVSNADSAVKLCNDAKGDHILLKIWRREGDMGGTRYLTVDNTKEQ